MRGILILATALALGGEAQAGPSPSSTLVPAPRRHVIIPPDILTPPSDLDMEAAYPPGASANDVGGYVQMGCLVTAGGLLTSCTIVEETPPDMGFGEAALSLASKYKMKPMTFDGQPISGARVTIPIRFVAPAPPPAPAA